MFIDMEKKFKEYRELDRKEGKILNGRDTSMLVKYGVFNIEGSSCIILSNNFSLRNNNDPNLIVFQKSEIMTMNKNYFLENAEFVRILDEKEDKDMRDFIDKKIESLKKIS
jgi:hypothetical protein